MNIENEDIERYDNELFRASDGKWMKFSDHEYAVQQLQKNVATQTQELRNINDRVLLQNASLKEQVDALVSERDDLQQQIATLRASFDDLNKRADVATTALHLENNSLRAKADGLAVALDSFMVRYNDTVKEYNGGLPAGVYVRTHRFNEAQAVLSAYREGK
jgi:uncharacterized coiled-coil DUF342 family protein